MMETNCWKQYWMEREYRFWAAKEANVCLRQENLLCDNKAFEAV